MSVLPTRPLFRAALILVLLLSAPPLIGPVHAQAAKGFDEACTNSRDNRMLRVVCADLVALDQMLVYNRFGSFNPYGMIFALRRDVVRMQPDAAAGDCGNDRGIHAKPKDTLTPGEVRLRDCRRPRPLVLRANVGDLLFVRVENLLAPEEPGRPPARVLSRDFCPDGRWPVGDHISRGSAQMIDPAEALCPDKAMTDADTKEPPSPEAEAEAGDVVHRGDWPRTRRLNLLAEGLMPVQIDEQPPHRACLGLDAVAPGESFDCLFEVVQEGTHFFASRAAPSGGQGDGGSITHGLFGAVMAERPGTRWYRSQVSQAAMDQVWEPSDNGIRHARSGALTYEALDPDTGVPVLNMARVIGGGDFRNAQAVEIVHADLNAIIWCDHGAPPREGHTPGTPVRCMEETAQPGTGDRTEEPRYDAYREFSVFFHDELKTFYTRNFEELARFGQLAGVRDGFAINYGASGMGTTLLANRKGIGPAAACVECLYEEFFLTSWANGDPALLEWFADDPSNVHHSYLNDPVVFRNFHAGPKETHVFHLHAHQWFAGNDQGRGSYLDSQTVAPGQGFTYNIYHGGRGHQAGKWSVGGSGNRNRTVGDSIFHCHLYPHFAQGMWALWRVHDVFEDGSRKLPDGQAEPGLSADIRPPSEVHFIRTGSVDQKTGAWSGGTGTPIPALVPLPGDALPPLPTYALPETPAAQDEAALTPDSTPPFVAGGPERLFHAQSPTQTVSDEPTVASVPDAMPGYPFYVAGMAGHRPPQAPHDIAREVATDGSFTGKLLSGGLGRHVIQGGVRELPLRLSEQIIRREADLAAALDKGDNRARLEALRSQMVAKALALGDMTAHLESADIRVLDPMGEPLERAAQAFHYNGAGLTVRSTDGSTITQDKGGYPTPTAPLPAPKPSDQANGAPPAPKPTYQVNGAPPAPGAPFADPCGGAMNREGDRYSTDPLTNTADYIIDPNLTGFRRYAVSAVQLDLVVNQAGWHDPQARIDVLTAASDVYKLLVGDGDSISPTMRDDAQPFFFRALSGECIEFRHTNELPKDLELDDFQVKTPTDTIGQHIHLVKFDVTSSDGSGNGWNYEDGTFAPDELMARRCAALHGGGITTPADAPTLAAWGTRAATEQECAALHHARIWRLPLTGTTTAGDVTILNRDLFQTTVQRWFADPIMTLNGRGRALDRTMRTVFSHDHFGPSSIQQHGLYTALLIEPDEVNICDPHKREPCTAMATADQVRSGSADWIGTHKIVRTPDETHLDYREFALAIADFALLYDPRDRESPDAIEPRPDAQHKGMARIYCEALSAAKGMWGGQIAAQCGQPNPTEPDTAPAWWAAGAPDDSLLDQGRLHSNLMDLASVQALRQHLIAYRSRAASPDGKPIAGGALARPVAPPERPESISVDHHDPYLVNYRNAPIPLRLGTKEKNGAAHADCAPLAMTRAGLAATADSEVVSRLRAGTMPTCSYSYQLAGARGDAGHVFSSWDPEDPDRAKVPPRDPETQQFEAYQDERILFRLVQGAQEVQHVFNITGISGPRNIDQRYSQGMRNLAVSVDPARRACFDAVRKGAPEQYEKWLNMTPGNPNQPLEPEATRQRLFEEALANCDNLEGYTSAQEIGISEHFELRTRLRSDVVAIESASRQNRAPAVASDDIKTASDYFYNFGTLDALWNGAWGLLRVYRDEPGRTALLNTWPGHSAPYILRSAKNPEAKPVGQSESASDTREPRAVDETPGCPLPGNPKLGHETVGLLVALRTADVWSGGTDYGAARRDPDGLMLALLSPLALRRDIEDSNWNDLSRASVLAAVRKAYDRPEPMVMRVNAGDCVVLRYVNLLQDNMPDALGDALMPKITPLNVDPEHAVTRTIGATSTTVAGTLTPLTTPETGLRPSALLGLSIGLPGGGLIRNLPLGYGINSEAMAPAQGELAQVSDVMRFYAGRMRIAAENANPRADGDMARFLISQTKTAAQALPEFSGVTLTLAEVTSPTQPVYLKVLGRDVTNATPLSPAQMDLLAELAKAELDRHIHWIPYAFGPVPVRVTGDVVSQAAHGLFGVIDVVPKGWTIPPSVNPPLGTSGLRRAASVPRDFGAGVRYDNARLGPHDADTQSVTVREFVIFYQDGLNHHDAQSQITWTWEDGRKVADKITPDCHVCDDSYDLGDQGVSYRSRPFASLLRKADIVTIPGRRLSGNRIEASDDLNAITFPPRFFDGQSTHSSGRPTADDHQPLKLSACAGEQVLVRVVHPGGRARQRSFVMNGVGYDDLFPGFGFPNAALLAPGKTVSAWLHPPQVLGSDGQRHPAQGQVLWHDGPTYLMAGGTWGLIDFSGDADCQSAGK